MPRRAARCAVTSESPWRARITADDYERHMAATGQPQAIADLLAELFLERAPLKGARVWFAGAGTGQLFDYFPPTTLAAYRVTCTDINPEYLDRLAGRIACTTTIDDIESPGPRDPVDLAIVTLVLEHVRWRLAVKTLCGAAARIFVVIQQDPPALVARPLEGTMAALRETPGRLLNRDELTAEFARYDFALTHESTRTVRDGKTMVALDLSCPR
jgi:Methyltransferase domain